MNHLSGCPVVRDEVMTLYQRVTINRKWQCVAFQQRVLWLRESEAKITLSHRKAHIDDGSTLNDWNGYLTSIEAAIKETPNLAKACRIKAGDALSIDIALKIKEVPVLLDESLDGQRWNKDAWRKRYNYVPSYGNGGEWWWLSDDDEDSRRLESVVVDDLPRMYTTSRHEVGKMPASVASWIERARSIAVPLPVFATATESA